MGIRDNQFMLSVVTSKNYSDQACIEQQNKCQRMANVTKQLPKAESREQQRKDIIQALQEGRMALREIDLERERNLSESGKKQPRPVYMVLEGIPANMRAEKSSTLGIMAPVPLAAYKRNASTFRLEGNRIKLDELPQRCFPDIHSLLGKMREQGERTWWEVYPPFT